MPRRKQHSPKRMKYNEGEKVEGEEEGEEGDDEQEEDDDDDDEDDDEVDQEKDATETKDDDKEAMKDEAKSQQRSEQDEELRHKMPHSRRTSEEEASKKHKRPREEREPHTSRHRPHEGKSEQSKKTPTSPAVSVIVPTLEPHPPAKKPKHRSSSSGDKSSHHKHKKNEKRTEQEPTSNSVMKLHSLVESVERNAFSGRSDKYSRSSSSSMYRQHKKPERPEPTQAYSQPVVPTTTNVEKTLKRIYAQYLPPVPSPSPTPSVSPSPESGDMPLDLSTKAKAATPNKKTHTKELPSPAKFPSVGTKEPGSSLENLEKKFGGNSAILERVGTRPPAVPNRNAFMSAFGVNLYSTALYSTQPILPSTQFQPRFPHSQPMSHSQSYHDANHRKNKESLGSKTSVPLSSTPVTTTHHSPKVSHRSERSEQNATTSPTKQQHTPNSHSPKYLGMGQSGNSSDPSESSLDKKCTNLRCSCGAGFETLYKLTLHLKESGHPPNRSKQLVSQDYPKLVRGQDMWLNQGSEQTRQILRCMQCGESFKTLPELTVHMIQTKHYANIVGSDPQKKLMKGSTTSVSDSSDTEMYRCKVCNEGYDDIETLQYHIHMTGHLPKSYHMGPYSPEAHSRDNLSDGDSSGLHSPPEMPVVKEERKHGLYNGNSPRLSDSPHSRYRDNSRERGDSTPVGSSKIRCENCAEKIDTAQFVEHVRVCVKKRSDSPQLSVDDTESDHNDKSKRAHRFDISCYLPSHLNGEVKDRRDSHSPRYSEADSSRISPSAEPRASPDLVKPPPSLSNVSALQDMESFIERSFSAAKTKKPRHHFFNDNSKFFSSPFMHQAMTMASSRTDQRPPEPPPSRPKSRDSPSSMASSLIPSSGLYQNKYLPPSYIPPSPEPSEASSRPPSSCGSLHQDRLLPMKDYTSSSNNVSPALSDIKDKNGNEMIKSPAPPRSPVAREFKQELPTEPKKEIVKQERGEPMKLDVSEDTHDEKHSLPSPTDHKSDKGTALKSLQGLVYGKSLNSEHPLDSLQKLIHNTNTPVSSSQPTSVPEKPPHSSPGLVEMSGALTQALPGTVILVNPIVTVVPGNDGDSPAVKISLPSQNSPQDFSKDSSRDSPFDDTEPREGDSDSDQSGEYQCGACKRNLASKGAYRYHLSRCHVLKYGIKDAINTSPYVYLPLDHTAKFTKYYEMANELANKGK